MPSGNGNGNDDSPSCSSSGNNAATTTGPLPEPQPMNITPTSPLHAAMHMGDLIRSSLNHLDKTTATTRTTTEQEKEDAPNESNNNNNNVPFTPGLLEGLAAGAFTLAVLTPVRSLILRTQVAQRLGMLPDLILTTSQIMASANAALYYGSLYGSYHYLHTFRTAVTTPITAISPTVDHICQTSLSQFQQQELVPVSPAAATATVEPLKEEESALSSSSPASRTLWKLTPKERVLEEFAMAMQLCRERQRLQRQEQK